MRRTIYWRAAICLAALFGGGEVSSTAGLNFIGVGPAEAKAYYTRKRVNGRWIQGRFASKSTIKSAAKSATRSAGKRHARISRSARRADEAFSEPAATPARDVALLSPTTGPRGGLATPLVPRSEDERFGQLREALRARASTLTTGTIATPQVLQGALEAQSVSFDFKSGTKTTVFSDGTSVAEPFDVGAMKGLAAAPPVPASIDSAAASRR